MNSRDVVDNLMRGQKTDRMGLFDSPWHDTLDKWIGSGYPVKADDNGNVKPVDPVDFFGFDMCGVGGWFDNLPIRDVMETVQETDQWIARRNGAGAVLKYWKKKSGTPEHIDFRMTSREVWETDYRPHLLIPDAGRINIESNRRMLQRQKAAGKWTFFGHLFIWETMRQSMGDICMYETLLLDPEWIHDYNRVYTDFFKAHYEIMFQEVGKPDGIWVYEDLGYKNGLFCSPKTLEDLFMPYYKEFVDFFHDHNLPVVLHSCGGVTDALPQIVEAGFDALNPMEVKAGCDTLAFARKWGDKLAFIGGLDALVLESGDRSLIKKEVIRLIEGMKEIGGRYVFGSDHSLSPNVKLDDFLYALDIYKEHMYY